MWTRFSVAAHLGAEELAARYWAARDPVARRRWQMIWLLVGGRRLGEVAAVTGDSPAGCATWRGATTRWGRKRSPTSGAGTRAPPRSLMRPAQRRLRKRSARRPPRAGAGLGARWRRGSPGARAGSAAARLGLPEAHRPQPTGAQTPAHQGGRCGGAGRLSENLSDIVDEERAREPGRAVEVWAVDEHRTGLPPVRRRVWAKKGQRPVATAHPRSEWLYLYGFVHPENGAVAWFLCTTVNRVLFAAVRERFAASVGAGKNKCVILVLDGAGWHARQHLEVPEGLRLVFLPPYSPELQPAEHLWPLVDEAIANQHFASLADLDQALARRCLALTEQPNTIKANTTFHGWPKAA